MRIFPRHTSRESIYADVTKDMSSYRGQSPKEALPVKASALSTNGKSHRELRRDFFHGQNRWLCISSLLLGKARMGRLSWYTKQPLLLFWLISPQRPQWVDTSPSRNGAAQVYTSKLDWEGAKPLLHNRVMPPSQRFSATIIFTPYSYHARTRSRTTWPLPNSSFEDSGIPLEY